MLRVAVVGAGPAGIYASDILLKAAEQIPGGQLSVDLFERLPAPYGLVRYGVAPDHPRIKGIITALREILDKGQIRYFGNVDFGTNLTLEDLKTRYHAVIFATGAIRDAELNIPGIQAEGSFGAADFVNWYDGHPDVARTWPLTSEQVAVIGNGNVALDISRVLVRDPEEMRETEIPDNVYEGLRTNPVTDVYIFGRKGPQQVKFTPLELRELGEVSGVEIVLRREDFEKTDEFLERIPQENKQAVILQRVMNAWLKNQERAGEETAEAPDVHADTNAEKNLCENTDENREGNAAETDKASTEETTGGNQQRPKRRIHLRFWSKPVEVLTENGKVVAIRVQRTAPDGSGGTVDLHEFETVPVSSVYRAIGYFGSPLPQVPFDADRGVIPNLGGRILTEEKPESPHAKPVFEIPEPKFGMYVTGWIKRGPVGLIGATKSDAAETIANLIDDYAAGKLANPAEGDPQAIVDLLRTRKIEFTDLAGWRKLDAHEQRLGEAAGRERIKVVSREEMVNISRAE